MILKHRMKQSKKALAFIFAFGLILQAAGITAKHFGVEHRLLDFASGVGCAAIILYVVGVALAAKNPKTQKQQEIEAKDERSIKIREKAAYSTFFITLAGLSIVEIAFVWLEYLIPCYVVIGLMAIHVISYFIFLSWSNNKL
jgi:uncharacterized membrane protein